MIKHLPFSVGLLSRDHYSLLHPTARCPRFDEMRNMHARAQLGVKHGYLCGSRGFAESLTCFKEPAELSEKCSELRKRIFLLDSTLFSLLLTTIDKKLLCNGFSPFDPLNWLGSSIAGPTIDGSILEDDEEHFHSPIFNPVMLLYCIPVMISDIHRVELVSVELMSRAVFRYPGIL
jgi:hypothetical protein